jgi:hypothetical protein
MEEEPLRILLLERALRSSRSTRRDHGGGVSAVRYPDV